MNHRKTSSCPQKTLYSSDWTWHNKLVLHSLDSEIFQRLPFVNLCQHICEKAVASCANEGKARSAVCTVRTSRVCGHAFCSFHPMTLLPGSPRCEFCLWARLQHDFTQGLKYVLPNSANLQMLQNFGEKKQSKLPYAERVLYIPVTYCHLVTLFVERDHWGHGALCQWATPEPASV